MYVSIYAYMYVCKVKQLKSYIAPLQDIHSEALRRPTDGAL